MLPGLVNLNMNANSAKAKQKKTDRCFASQRKKKCAECADFADPCCHFEYSDEKHLNDGLGGNAGQKLRQNREKH